MDVDPRRIGLYVRKLGELLAEPMEGLRVLWELQELRELLLTAQVSRESASNPRERRNPSHAWAQSHRRVKGPPDIPNPK